MFTVMLAQASAGEEAEIEVLEKKEEEVEEEQEVIAEDEEMIEKKDPTGINRMEDLDMLLENEDDVIEGSYECSRMSPKEIFHTELHPRLLDVLDEMSYFVESVLERIESALRILLPHVKDSPIGNLKVEEVFPEVRKFMFGTMRDVYDLVKTSWRDLIRTHVASKHDAKLQLEALRTVRDAQLQGEERIKASLMELSVTLKAIVLNSIHVVQDSLQLPENTDDNQAAIFVNRILPRVAPNFLGTLMMKIMEKGEDPEAYKKLLTNTLRHLTGPVNQMYQELELIVEDEEEEEREGGESDPEVLLKDFWKRMVDECHLRLISDPLNENDFELIFQNEEYLAGLVLGLMATF